MRQKLWGREGVAYPIDARQAKTDRPLVRTSPPLSMVLVKRGVLTGSNAVERVDPDE